MKTVELWVIEAQKEFTRENVGYFGQLRPMRQSVIESFIPIGARDLLYDVVKRA